MLDAEARARFDLAMVHVQNGRLEEAAQEFQHAYDLSQRSELLYNIYLAWRDAGRPGLAAEALADYLETRGSDDPGRLNLEARLRTLRAQAQALSAAAGHTEAAENAAEAAESDAQLEPTDALSDPDSWSEGSHHEPSATDAPTTHPHPAGWALVGIGSAVLIAGVVTGAVALDLSEQLADECRAGTCPAERASDGDLGQALATTTDVLLPLGAVAAGVGLVLLFVLDEPDAEVSPTASCTDTGCSVGVRGRL